MLLLLHQRAKNPQNGSSSNVPSVTRRTACGREQPEESEKREEKPMPDRRIFHQVYQVNGCWQTELQF